MGMSAFPSFMTQATPATQPLINAEPAVAAQTEQNPQVGQVMPGVQGADAPVVAQNGPSRDVKLTFAQIAPPPGSMVLRGINPNGSIEFGMRSDEVVTKAMLNLEYTPSPSLLPVQSQLKVYLNDELMGVLPVTKEQLGKKTLAQMPINPLFITDFNRVRLEFVGHYQDVCENPASTTLWLDVGRSSGLDLTYQTLNVKNDLSHFPVPFFDPRDNRTNTLPMVFAGAPDVRETDLYRQPPSRPRKGRADLCSGPDHRGADHHQHHAGGHVPQCGRERPGYHLHARAGSRDRCHL